MLVVAVCAVVVWALFIRAWAPSDLQVFLRAGRAVGHGSSPYPDPHSAQVWSGSSFVYPYVTAWWFAPLSALSEHAAVLLYFAAGIGALVLTARLLRGDRGPLTPLLFVLATEPVISALQHGTITTWLLLGLAIAWRYRTRTAVLVAVLTVVMVAKLFLLPVLAWLVITRRLRAAALTAALSAAIIVVGCPLAGLPVSDYVHMVSALSAHEGPHGSSVVAYLYGGGVPYRYGTVIAAAAAMAIIAVAWWRYRASADERIPFCAAIGASLVLSPIVWTHYLALLVVVPLLWGWGRPAMAGFVAISWLRWAPHAPSFLLAPYHAPGAGVVRFVAQLLIVLAVVATQVRRRRTRSAPEPTRPRPDPAEHHGQHVVVGYGAIGPGVAEADGGIVAEQPPARRPVLAGPFDDDGAVRQAGDHDLAGLRGAAVPHQ